MTRLPITELGRNARERADVRLSWARPDLNFFAAGACHVLAFAFLERYPQAGYRPRFIRPSGDYCGTHVYVTDGALAFDAQGYVPERELLAGHWAAYRAAQPAWSAEVLEVVVPLAEFCAGNNHRAPWDFPPGVWARAHAYLERFAAPPASAPSGAPSPPTGPWMSRRA